MKSKVNGWLSRFWWEEVETEVEAWAQERFLLTKVIPIDIIQLSNIYKRRTVGVNTIQKQTRLERPTISVHFILGEITVSYIHLGF